MQDKVINRYIKNLNSIITESTNTKKYRDRTLQVIRDYFPQFADYEYKGDAPNPDHLSIAEYMEKEFRNEFFHGNVHQTVMRLEPIMMKIALDLGYSSPKMDSEKLNRLREIVHYITSKTNESKRTGIKLNFDISKMTEDNTSFENLDETFGTIIDEIRSQEDDRLNSVKFTGEMNPDYKIFSDIDYDTARLYGVSSCSDSPLCYITEESTWNAYTASGRNTVYLVLRKDYKDIPEIHGPDTPYDEYGLSMIFLFIDPKGVLAYSNTRWNHETGSNRNVDIDHAFTKEQISNLLNVNFNEVFKPSGKWDSEIKKQFKLYLATGHSDIQELYDFNNGRILLEYKGSYNVLTEDKRLLTGDMWFSTYPKSDFDEPLRIYYNGKYNFINEKGALVYDKPFDEWFDESHPFETFKDLIYAQVCLDEKWNWLLTDGTFLSDDWFYNIGEFRGGGYAMASGKDDDDNSEYLIDMTGSVMMGGLEEILPTNNQALFRVKKDGKYNMLNILTGTLFFSEYIDNIDLTVSDGFFVFWVRDEEDNIKYNYVSQRGKILYQRPIEEWFEVCYRFKHSFGRVRKDKKYNFIDKDGNLLYKKPIDEWFDFAEDFGSAGTTAADVEIDGKRYVMLENGEVYPYKNKEN